MWLTAPCSTTGPPGLTKPSLAIRHPRAQRTQTCPRIAPVNGWNCTLPVRRDVTAICRRSTSGTSGACAAIRRSIPSQVSPSVAPAVRARSIAASRCGSQNREKLVVRPGRRARRSRSPGPANEAGGSWEVGDPAVDPDLRRVSRVLRRFVDLRQARVDVQARAEPQLAQDPHEMPAEAAPPT